MFKRILTLLMSLTLILTITACGSGTTTVKVTNEDGSTQTVAIESLKTQIQSARPISDYTGNTTADKMDSVLFGLNEKGQPIEWIVLEKDGNKAFLLSKYLISKHKYNDEGVDITWENCTMRKWLNSDFINTMFSKKEQGAILTTSLINNDNYYSKGGNNTKDKIFLLSIDESEKYFSTITQLKATRNKDGSSHYWWLRSPGDRQDRAAYVFSDGYIRRDGTSVDRDHHYVRPALWVKY